MRLKIQDLYDQLPTLQCKGDCWRACGAIRMTDVEYARLRSSLPMVPRRSRMSQPGSTCPLLTKKKQCQRYTLRPMICRLYGLVDIRRMRCPHGCKPSRFLTDDEGQEFLRQAKLLSMYSDDLRNVESQ